MGAVTDQGPSLSLNWVSGYDNNFNSLKLKKVLFGPKRFAK